MKIRKRLCCSRAWGIAEHDDCCCHLPANTAPPKNKHSRSLNFITQWPTKTKHYIQIFSSSVCCCQRFIFQVAARSLGPPTTPSYKLSPTAGDILFGIIKCVCCLQNMGNNKYADVKEYRSSLITAKESSIPQKQFALSNNYVFSGIRRCLTCTWEIASPWKPC